MDIQSRSWPVADWISNACFMVAESKFILPYWAERVERPRQRWKKTRKQKARRAKEAVQVVQGGWPAPAPGASPPSLCLVLPDNGGKDGGTRVFASQSQSLMRNFKILLAALAGLTTDKWRTNETISPEIKQ